MSEELSLHKTELERVQTEGEEALERVVAEPPHRKDYAAKVEELRELVSKKCPPLLAKPLFLPLQPDIQKARCNR